MKINVMKQEGTVIKTANTYLNDNIYLIPSNTNAVPTKIYYLTRNDLDGVDDYTKNVTLESNRHTIVRLSGYDISTSNYDSKTVSITFSFEKSDSYVDSYSGEIIVNNIQGVVLNFPETDITWINNTSYEVYNEQINDYIDLYGPLITIQPNDEGTGSVIKTTTISSYSGKYYFNIQGNYGYISYAHFTTVPSPKISIDNDSGILIFDSLVDIDIARLTFNSSISSYTVYDNVNVINNSIQLRAAPFNFTKAGCKYNLSDSIEWSYIYDIQNRSSSISGISLSNYVKLNTPTNLSISNNILSWELDISNIGISAPIEIRVYNAENNEFVKSVTYNSTSSNMDISDMVDSVNSIYICAEVNNTNYAIYNSDKSNMIEL